jgi:hypothetical protein
LSADVEAVVMRALSKDPCERYASASDLALALASCRVAGKWTFGDATQLKKSSRPPPPAGLASLVVPAPARLPAISIEGDAETPLPSR